MANGINTHKAAIQALNIDPIKYPMTVIKNGIEKTAPSYKL